MCLAVNKITFLANSVNQLCSSFDVALQHNASFNSCCHGDNYCFLSKLQKRLHTDLQAVSTNKMNTKRLQFKFFEFFKRICVKKVDHKLYIVFVL